MTAFTLERTAPPKVTFRIIRLYEVYLPNILESFQDRVRNGNYHCVASTLNERVFPFTQFAGHRNLVFAQFNCNIRGGDAEEVLGSRYPSAYSEDLLACGSHEIYGQLNRSIVCLRRSLAFSHFEEVPSIYPDRVGRALGTVWYGTEFSKDCYFLRLDGDNK